MIEKEPVRFWAGITGLVQAIIPLLLVFDLIDWSTDQIAAVMGLLAAIGFMFMFFYVREKVSPV